MDPDPLVVFQRPPLRLRRPQLRQFAETLSATVAGGRPFCCLVAGDRELRRLNAQYRGKDQATDVLSFPAAAGPALGDIAVSGTRAAAQAREFGHDTETEIQILMLHGVLHLLGYDHESDRGAMRRLETRWRKRLGLPAALIERTRS